MNETWKFIPQTHLLLFFAVLQVDPLQTGLLINSTLCSSFQQFKRMFGVFITEYATLLSIFLTRGNFCFDNASMKNKSSVDNYTHFNDWKNFPQTSFWLCTFKTLFLLYYPHTFGVGNMFTPQYDLGSCPLMSSYQKSWQSTIGLFLETIPIPGHLAIIYPDTEITSSHIILTTKLELNVISNPASPSWEPQNAHLHSNITWHSGLWGAE